MNSLRKNVITHIWMEFCKSGSTTSLVGNCKKNEKELHGKCRRLKLSVQITIHKIRISGKNRSDNF